MKKSKLLASVALAGVIMGAQVALADQHEEGAKEEKGKNSCKSKDKNSCKGKKDKNSCKGKDKKAEGSNQCSGANGCDGKEHPAAPEKPKVE